MKIGRTRGTQDICDHSRLMFTADTVSRKGGRLGLLFAFIREMKISR